MSRPDRDEVVDGLLKGEEFPDGDIFDLELHSLYQVRRYIRDRFYQGRRDNNLGRKKGALTRRANLLWKRVQAAVWKQKRIGATGIYRAEVRWEEGLGHLYAVDRAEAEQFGKMFFAYLIKDVGEKFQVEFVKYGDPSDIAQLNDPLISQLERKIEDNVRTRDALQKKIDRFQARIDAMKLVESHQHMIETEIDENLVEKTCDEV
tara:strand:+ start:2458 stop:3072 length:615 start_codon:yes stop_codon:yes gene_type:complete